MLLPSPLTPILASVGHDLDSTNSTCGVDHAGVPHPLSHTLLLSPTLLFLPLPSLHSLPFLFNRSCYYSLLVKLYPLQYLLAFLCCVVFIEKSFTVIFISCLRRKKKCIRCSEGDGESAPKPDDTPLEDDVMSSNYNEQHNSSSSKSEGEKLPVANTTFGALVDIETTKDASSTSGQSNSSALPPVTLGNPTATT